MEQTLTAKLRLYPKELTPYEETAKAYMAACNYASSIVYEEKTLSAYRLRNLIYQRLRSEYALKSQMADSVCREVIANYKTMQSQDQWHHAMYKRPSYALVRGRDYTLNLESHEISLNTIGGRIQGIRFISRGFDEYLTHGRLGTARLTIQDGGKVFLLVPVTIEALDAPKEVLKVVGVDRGIRFSMVTYDGEKARFYSGKEIAHKRRKYRKVREKLQKRGTRSARRRLKMIGRRENRWINNVNHCMSKTLVRSYEKGTQFVLENLENVRTEMKRITRIQRTDLNSWSFGDLAFKVEYKARRRGQSVRYIDPRYTSQTCPQCGYVSTLNRNKRQHLFMCRRCSYTLNDDLVAARNIYNKGL